MLKIFYPNSFLRTIFVGLLLSVLPLSLQATDIHDHSKERTGQVLPALGIYEDLGKWPGVVRLAYDPSDAHEAFQNAASVRWMIGEAAARWSRVSGIRFEILPNGSYPEDHFLPPAERDGIVRVSWKNLPGIGGRASISYGHRDQSVDHEEYTDGRIDLSSAPSWSGAEFELIHVLVHEIGHVIGLGHSDNPVSVMHADPYNNLQYPLEDDIRAAQVLYGPSPEGFSPAVPVPSWVYQPPAQSTSANLSYVLQPNQFSSSDFARKPGLELSSARNSYVTSINADVSDDSYLILTGPVGSFASINDVNVSTQIIVTDPYGYVYARRDWLLDCPARHACLRSMSLPFFNEDIKKIAGEWKVFVIEDPTQVAKPGLLLQTSFLVEPFVVTNSPPTARVRIEATQNPMELRLKLLTQDYEGHNVSVRWNAFDAAEPVAENGQTPWKNFLYSAPGDYELYVQVNDDGPRYVNTLNGEVNAGSSAGRGFQTLLRISFSLPLNGKQSVDIISSSVASNADNTQNFLAFQPYYQPTDLWPAAFNGVAPPRHLGISLNNIGVLQTDRMELHTCVNILENGMQSNLGGIEKFDLVFSILDIDEGRVQAIRSRPFNQQSSVTDELDTPDCSGSYESVSGIYSDLLVVGDNTFSVKFDITDADNLVFVLQEATALSGQILD